MIEVKGIKLLSKMRYASSDPFGYWFAYERFPDKRADGWEHEGDFFEFNFQMPTMDWEDSLHEIIHTEDGFQLVKPRPDLKIDDPVMVRLDDNEKWVRRHFAGWSESGVILVWVNGYTSFTINTSTTFPQYRLPTPEELNQNK